MNMKMLIPKIKELIKIYVLRKKPIETIRYGGKQVTIGKPVFDRNGKFIGVVKV